MSDTIQYKPIPGLNETSLNKIIEMSVKELATKTEVTALESDITTSNAQITSNTNAIQDLETLVGTEELPTTNKTLKGAIAETFQSVSNGKKLIASAITDKGVATSNNDTFQVMADNIGKIQTSTVSADSYRTDRVLIFEDDFNSSSLNSNIWTFETGYIRNNELQNYSNSTNNIYLENSNLVIKAIRENTQAYKDGSLQTFNWTSGSIQTNNKFEFQYGRLEAKIKLPNEIGAFPAFWTLGATYDYQYIEDSNRGNKGELWSYCGEIDIMEQIPGNGNTTATIHRDYGSGNQKTLVGSKTIDTSEYHIYSLEWTEEKMEFFIDDISVGSYTLTNRDTMFKMPHFIILNLAVGASGGIPPTTTNEYFMYVDWVRLYAPVKQTLVQNIDLNLGTDSIVLSNIGDEYQIRPLIEPSSSINKVLKWSTDKDNVATVYGGRVVGIGNGECNITVSTDNGISKSCLVKVGSTTGTTDELTSISLSDVIVRFGNTITLNPVFMPSNTTKTNVEFSTDNPTIATVDNSSGVVTGKSIGNCNITCTSLDDSSISTSCVVTVVSETLDESSWTFSASSGGESKIENGMMYLKDITVDGSTNSNAKYNDTTIKDKNTTITVKAKILDNYSNNGGKIGECFRIQIDNGTSGFAYAINNTLGVFDAVSRPNGQLPSDAVGTITLNTLYTFKVEYDVDNSQCKFYVDDVLLRTDNFITNPYAIGALRLMARAGSIEIYDIIIE